MGGSTIITCVFALYGTVRLFNMLFALCETYGHFIMRFCLIWDRTYILSCVFALNGTEGHFNMRFCLICDRLTF